MIFEPRPKLARDPAFLLDELRGRAFLLDLFGDALIAGGELLGVLRHQPADFVGAVLRTCALGHQHQSRKGNTAGKPNQHPILSVGIDRNGRPSGIAAAGTQKVTGGARAPINRMPPGSPTC